VKNTTGKRCQSLSDTKIFEAGHPFTQLSHWSGSFQSFIWMMY